MSKEEKMKLYRDMVLGRKFEDQCAQMYYRGKMFGFVHLYNGQEAVSSGVIQALSHDDYVCSTYRDHVHALSKGVPAKQVMAELFGKQTGCSKGRGGSMHLFSAAHRFLGGFAFIGEGIPIALGAAFSSLYQHNLWNEAMNVTACFFGDGTTNNGQFYECLNMAVLWKLPIIFVVENNQWAIGMAHHRSTSEVEIYEKGKTFGLPAVEVDGMDVLAVHEVALQAVERAKSAKGPTLIEALTYRFRGHSLADPDELRAKQQKAIWMARDPILQFGNWLIEQQIATEVELQQIHHEIELIIDEAVQFAQSSEEPTDLYQYVYATENFYV
nr:pyruvate dehydrogenase E1 component alpha subunit [Cyanidioschyzonaceae sp. 1]